ncbi:RICIN domain-containing protein [Paenibacillus alkalitolerans]|nr:RICIN domain-containing protein [Paenibacillus alkalitolerans]
MAAALRCVDVQGRSTADGAGVIQWADNNGANQQWRIVQVN